MHDFFPQMTLLRNICLIVLTHLLATSLPAQVFLNGKIKGDTSPLEFINVLLVRSNDSTFVKGTVTDSLGQFILPTAVGKYRLVFSSVGYKKLRSDDFLIEDLMDSLYIGEFNLIAEDKQLDQIVIVSDVQPFEVTAGKMSINISSSPIFKGRTVLEILERSPGIVVDRQNRTIFVNGAPGIQLVINGKSRNLPQNLVIDYLDGVPSDQFEKIEVVSSPSSKYGLENSTVLNLVSKKDAGIGTNGSFTANVGYGYRSKAGASLNLHHRYSKGDVFGGYSFTHNNIYELGEISQQNGDPADLYHYISNLERNGTRGINDLNVGINHFIRKSTSIGILLTGYCNSWKMDQETNSNFSDKETTLINSVIKENNQWSNWTANLNVSQKVGKTGSLEYEIDYLSYSNTNPSIYFNRYNSTKVIDSLVNIRVEKTTPIKTVSSNIDFKKKFGSNSSFESGLKISSTNFLNDFTLEREMANQWIADNSISSSTRLDEDIFAAYAAISSTIKSNVIFQGGVRYEYTKRSITSNLIATSNLLYENIFPTVKLSIPVFSNKSMINLSYDKRLVRPAFTDLAPYTFIVSPSTIVTGNPSLQLSIENSYAASIKLPGWIVTYRFSSTENPIVPFQPDKDNSYVIFKPINLQRITTNSIFINGDLATTNRLTLQSSLLGLCQYNILNSNYKQERFSMRGSMNVKVKFEHGYSMEVLFFYQSPILLGTVRREAFGGIDLGIVKQINKSSTLSFSLTDLLWTNKFKLAEDVYSTSVSVQFNRFQEPRIFKLTYSFLFNKTDAKLVKKNLGVEDIKNRIAY
jgi:hypothetical protein